MQFVCAFSWNNDLLPNNIMETALTRHEIYMYEISTYSTVYSFSLCPPPLCTLRHFMKVSYIAAISNAVCCLKNVYMVLEWQLFDDTLYTLWFLFKTHCACTNICIVYADMVKGRQILMFSVHLHVANVVSTNFCFEANQQKYRTLVPAKKRYLKISMHQN